jgi:uncharacterized protein
VNFIQGGNVKSRSLIFVLLMPVMASCAAQQPAIDQNPRVIQVDGHGEVRASPDQALISFAIETKGSNAQEAGTQNAQIADKVIAALKAKVGASGKVETGGDSLSPLYAKGRRPMVDPTLGWIASNSIYVKCDESVAGDVLDVAEAAGARGTANIQQETGTATIALSVVSNAPTANEASKLVAEKTHEVADAIKPKLAEKGTVSIGWGTVRSGSAMVGNETQKNIGYYAVNSISVETTAIDRVGSLIDTAIAAGASRETFVKFELRDDSKARSEAIAEASKDAQLKANAAAQTLGLKIKRIVKITSVGNVKIASTGDFIPQQPVNLVAPLAPVPPGPPTLPPHLRLRAEAFSAQTTAMPINPSELTVEATVNEVVAS